jgi:hypothetical protein
MVLGVITCNRPWQNTNFILDIIFSEWKIKTQPPSYNVIELFALWLYFMQYLS